jgi:hypothetical protein
MALRYAGWTHFLNIFPLLLLLLQVAARLRLVEQHVGYPEVVVVGGGYAGVELAAVVAERLQGRGRIKLVTSAADILETSPHVSGPGWVGSWVTGWLVVRIAGCFWHQPCWPGKRCCGPC